MEHQKNDRFFLSFFYPLRKQWHLISRRLYIITEGVSHLTGISFRNDEILYIVQMIYDSAEIDEIHGFAVTVCEWTDKHEYR